MTHHTHFMQSRLSIENNNIIINNVTLHLNIKFVSKLSNKYIKLDLQFFISLSGSLNLTKIAVSKRGYIPILEVGIGI